MFIISFITLYMFFMALMCFTIEFKHLLISMVCLEFLALMLFMTLSSSHPSIHSETLYSLLYLPIAVCEAALGLSITIKYTTKKGNELLKTF